MIQMTKDWSSNPAFSNQFFCKLEIFSLLELSFLFILLHELFLGSAILTFAMPFLKS